MFIPTIIIFVYTNILQMQLLLHIWKSSNYERIERAAVIHSAYFFFNRILMNLDLSSAVSIANSVYFQLKQAIDLILLGGIVALTMFIFYPLACFIFFSSLWISQIAKNIMLPNRRAPSMFYIISVSLQHFFVPVLYVIH